MSKVDDILRDELDPEDLEQSTRGGKNGRETDKSKKDSGPKLQPLGERVGFAGLVVVTVLAAAVGLVGCKPVSGTPHTSPTTATCDESQDCWNCRTMGNRQCGPGEVNQ